MHCSSFHPRDGERFGLSSGVALGALVGLATGQVTWG